MTNGIQLHPNVVVGIVGGADALAWAQHVRRDGVEVVVVVDDDADEQLARTTAEACGGEVAGTFAQLLERRPVGVIVGAAAGIDAATDALLEGASLLFATPPDFGTRRLHGLVEAGASLGLTATLGCLPLAMAGEVVGTVNRGEIGDVRSIELTWEIRGGHHDPLGAFGPAAFALVQALHPDAPIVRVAVHARGVGQLLTLTAADDTYVTIALKQKVHMAPPERVTVDVGGRIGTVATCLQTQETHGPVRARHVPSLMQVRHGSPTVRWLSETPSVGDARAAEAGQWLDGLRQLVEPGAAAPASDPVPTVEGADAVRVLALLDAARRSAARAGDPVAVEDVG